MASIWWKNFLNRSSSSWIYPLQTNAKSNRLIYYRRYNRLFCYKWLYLLNCNYILYKEIKGYPHKVDNLWAKIKYRLYTYFWLAYITTDLCIHTYSSLKAFKSPEKSNRRRLLFRYLQKNIRPTNTIIIFLHTFIIYILQNFNNTKYAYHTIHSKLSL